MKSLNWQKGDDIIYNSLSVKAINWVFLKMLFCNLVATQQPDLSLLDENNDCKFQNISDDDRVGE